MEHTSDPSDQRALLEHVMAAMAGGDQSAALDLVDGFGDRLAASVRRHLRSLGRVDVLVDADEVDGLVIDAALVIADHARGWSPQAAPPWVWADRAIRAAVVAHVGHPSVEVDAEDEPTAPTSGGGCDEVSFHALAEVDARTRLLAEAIGEAARSERDATVHIEYQVQKRSGDPSPARTVAAMCGLSDANVRQIDCRVRTRLRRLAERAPRYAGLTELDWVSPARAQFTEDAVA